MSEDRANTQAEMPAPRLSLTDWLSERLDNCERIAGETAIDRDGWLDDARYFRASLSAMKALEESVKLQSHYAALLNQHDGGQRMIFKSAEEWIGRLTQRPAPPHPAVDELHGLVELLPADSDGRRVGRTRLTASNLKAALSGASGNSRRRRCLRTPTR